MVWGIRRVAAGSGRRAVNAPIHKATSVTPSPTGRSACGPGTVRAAVGRGRRRPRTETWHPQPSAVHSARAAVAQCEEAAAKSGMGRASTRPPSCSGPVAGTHWPLRPVKRHRSGPHRTPEPGPRSRPRFSQRPEPNGEALPAVQNLFRPPVSLCARRRSGYGSIVTAWSRGTAIFIGPGAVGMVWDGGRTTGQAGPV